VSVEERVSVVPELEPEMVSRNRGSINFGLYPILDAYDEFECDLQREYLEGTRDLIFPNTFEDCDTKPELECYDVGHLYNVNHMLDRGFLNLPLHLQSLLGIHGGIGADGENLVQMYRLRRSSSATSFCFR
jgi:uncharacterized protein (DUF849 family)